MSDTPRTDAQACHVSVDRAGCITLSYSADGGYVPRLLSEQLERENAALRRDVYQCPPTSENGYEGLKWADAAEEVLRTYINVVRVTGHPCPENLVICRELRAAIDAARAKEGQP